MARGTRVQDQAGRFGQVAGTARIVGWDWVLAVKFDDGSEEIVLLDDLEAVGPLVSF